MKRLHCREDILEHSGLARLPAINFYQDNEWWYPICLVLMIGVLAWLLYYYYTDKLDDLQDHHVRLQTSMIREFQQTALAQKKVRKK